MKPIIIIAMLLLPGCAGTVFDLSREKSYSCDETILAINKITGELELMPANDLCFEPSLQKMLEQT